LASVQEAICRLAKRDRGDRREERVQWAKKVENWHTECSWEKSGSPAAAAVAVAVASSWLPTRQLHIGETTMSTGYPKYVNWLWLWSWFSWLFGFGSGGKKYNKNKKIIFRPHK